MQALLKVIAAEDVAFVPATKEIVVSMRGDETLRVVLSILQDRLALKGRGDKHPVRPPCIPGRRRRPARARITGFVLRNMG